MGRSDDWFTYGDTVVHPHIFRSQLAAVPGIAEYQVTQTSNGAHIAAVATGHLDSATLSAALTAELRRVGLDDPTISVATVEAIERHPDSGKLRRFIRLPSPSPKSRTILKPNQRDGSCVVDDVPAPRYGFTEG